MLNSENVLGFRVVILFTVSFRAINILAEDMLHLQQLSIISSNLLQRFEYSMKFAKTERTGF